jgi:hypothetical protein
MTIHGILRPIPDEDEDDEEENDEEAEWGNGCDHYPER